MTDSSSRYVFEASFDLCSDKNCAKTSLMTILPSFYGTRPCRCSIAMVWSPPSAHVMGDSPRLDGLRARHCSGSLLRTQAKRLDWIKWCRVEREMPRIFAIDVFATVLARRL